MTKTSILAILFGMALAVGVKAASATTFTYSGEIDAVESAIGLLQKGDTFTFDLAIDTAQAGVPVDWKKTYAAQPTAVHFSNGYVLHFTPTITVDPVFDFIAVTGAASGDPIGNVQPFFLQSYDYGPVADAALPNLASFFAANPFAPIQFMFSDPGSGLQAEAGAYVTIVSEAPIPAALPLFISALGGLGFFGWRSREAAISLG